MVFLLCRSIPTPIPVLPITITILISIAVSVSVLPWSQFEEIPVSPRSNLCLRSSSRPTRLFYLPALLTVAILIEKRVDISKGVDSPSGVQWLRPVDPCLRQPGGLLFSPHPSHYPRPRTQNSSTSSHQVAVPSSQ